MWALRAVAIMLSIQAGTLDLLDPPPGVSTLPAVVPNVNNLPLSLPTPPQLKAAPNKQGSAPRKHPAAPKPGKCAPAARYFLASGKLQGYLMSTLPSQIEDLVKCDGVDMAGLLGSLLSTLDNSDLLSVLDPNSLLKGAGLDGILGNEGNKDSSKSPSGPKGTGAVNDLLSGGKGALGGLLDLRGGGRSIGGLLGGQVIPNVGNSLNDMAENVGNLKESVQAKVTEILPDTIKGPLTDVMNINLKELVLEFEVGEVTEESTDIIVGVDEIQVHSRVSATIAGKGALGPVINLLQFKADMEVTMKIVTSSNNTQCVNLDVQDTHIQVNEMQLQLVETITGTVPLPVPLPLNDVISIVLTAHINENLEKSDSCAIVLKDFNDCKNATGTFKYQVQSSRISPKGLSIFYCVKGSFGNKTVPVPGGRLPPDPKNASISVTMSSWMLKVLLVNVAKQSSVKTGNLDANIAKVVYAFQKNKLITLSYDVVIKKDGEPFAAGKTQLVITHDSKISKNKLVSDIKLKSSENKVDPPEAEGEVASIMTDVMNKAWSVFNEMYKNMNTPDGLSSFTLTNASVNPLKSNDLQASN